MGTYLEQKLKGYLEFLEFFKNDKKNVEEILEIIEILEKYPNNIFISKLLYEIEEKGVTIQELKEILDDDMIMIRNIEDEIVENFEGWEAIENEQSI